MFVKADWMVDSKHTGLVSCYIIMIRCAVDVEILKFYFSLRKTQFAFSQNDEPLPIFTSLSVSSLFTSNHVAN